MSLIILDGHNAAFRLPGRGEADRRERLLDSIRRGRPEGSEELWIVFDSARNEEAHRHSLHRETQTGRVIYAPGSADDWIVEQAESGELPGDAVVATDDQELRLRLSGRVVCWSLDQFFGRSRRR